MPETVYTCCWIATRKKSFTLLILSKLQVRHFDVVCGACLILFSFSLYVQKIETLRWTPYADECLKTLSENPESLHDILMTQIVRLQLIQERVKDSPWYDTTGDGSTAFKAPTIFYLKALKNQMETFRQQIPNEVRENCM